MAETNLAPAPDKSNQVLSTALGSNEPFSITTKKTTAAPKYVGLKVPNVEQEMAQREAFLKPGVEKEASLVKQLGQFEGEKALSDVQGRIKEAEGTVRAQQQYADAMQMKELESKRKALEDQMGKEFIPTKESAQDVATLFSLINVVGFAMGAGGKANAQQAMSAMNGMLEGHQKGRDDLYKKEKDVFEENLKVLKNKWEMLQADMERAATLAQTNLATATSQAKLDAAKYGADFISKNIDKFGLIPTLEMVRKGNEAAGKAYDTATKHKQDIEVKNAEMRNQYEMAQIKAQSGGRASAINQRLAYMIQNSFLQAGQDVINAAKHPGQTLGAFSGLTGADSKGIIDAVKKVGVRKVTDADQRTYEQIISGLESHMARVMGGGYATSATKAQMDMYKTQIPRAGDPSIVGLMFLARMKQELGLELQGFTSHPGASPEQVTNMANVYGQVDSLIPFTVGQIQQAIGESPDLQRTLSESRKWTESDEKRMRELENKASGEKKVYAD